MNSGKRIDGRLLVAFSFIIVGLVFYLALAGYSFISYTCWSIALIVMYYWILKRIKPKYPKTEKFLNKLASYCIIFFCMIFALTESVILYGSIAPEKTVETEYVIVLGAGVNGTVPSRSLSYRLETALEYLNSNPDAVCIVSGGQGAYEEISEAECMYLWLENEGVQADRLITEDQSRNTSDNIENSLAVIQEITGKKPDKVTIITEGYHMLRASMMMSDYGVEPVCVPAETGLPVLAANYFIREVFAMWKYLIIG